MEVEICSVCGSASRNEYITTCCRCKTVSEHTYCMLDQPTDVPEGWVCEECRDNREHRNYRSFMLPKSTKVKYIPLEEVAKLNSGFMVKPQIGFPNHVRRDRPRITNHQPKQDKLKCNNQGLLTKDDYRKVVNGVVFKGECSKWVENGPVVPDVEAKICNTAKPYSGKGKDLHYEDEPSVPIIPAIKVEICNTAKLSPENNREGKDLHYENEPSVRTVPNIELKICDTAKPSWEGMFEVVNMGFPISCGIRAQHQSKIRLEAYQASKELPQTLKIKIVPRTRIWPKIIMGPPSHEDIAMYFFPKQDKRSKRDYLTLVDMMSSHDMGMASRQRGVELLIFSSKLRCSDYQRIDGKMYLWGIFQAEKG